MKLRTTEWIGKADGDWAVARREMAAADPVWDVVCFHAQQCAEKYLKAFLEEQGSAFGKTHDLAVLLDSCAGRLPELLPEKPQLAYLSTLGIAARYPGVSADQAEAEAAVKTAEGVRTVVRARLSLP